METVRGPKSASARPGPCTRPRSADALTRQELPPGRKAPGVKTSHRGWRQGDAEDASSQPQATHSLG
jgi:hypothetical protein